MKTKLKLFGIIALAAVLIFSMAACENDSAKGESSEPFVPGPFNDITASELVAGMTVGWNLGNTFDAPTETAWGNPTTSKANFDALKDAGFNTIRIPVTWSSKTSGAGAGITIRANNLARIKDVVNYAARNDMYIILNTHHDESLFKFMDSNVEDSLKTFEKLWQQIAEAFMDYDEKLIFEALNEPRTHGSQFEWQGGTDEERKNLNRYYQLFIDTVRVSGGNNDRRILMVNTYAASAEAPAMNGLVVPTDTIANKIIVSYHSYEPYRFALHTGNGAVSTWSKANPLDTNPITERVDRAYNVFVNKGYPVVIGEMGAMNRSNAPVRAEWAEFYVGYAHSKGIPCVWWDNGATTGDGELFGLLNRNSNKFAYPDIVDAIMRGCGVIE